MYRRILFPLLLLILLPVLLMAGTKGRIKGKVVDLQTGEPLIGANVIVLGTSTGAATDASGEFILQNLEPGVYSVRASYLGYQSITINGVRVNADLTTSIDFDLPSEDIQVGTVEIVAQKPLIQKDNTNAVRITSSEDIENLPVRGVNNILRITAGVVISNDNFHIRGGRADEVGYYLEGVSIKNPVSGARGVSLAQDALEEIQVQVGGYPAEFGGSNAGIVRQSLRSGGPEFKASFEHITDNITFKSKKDAFDGKKRLGAYWYGYDETVASLSGPLFSQNVKFFTNFSYNFRRERNPQEFPGANVGLVSDFVNEDTVNFVYSPGPRPKNQQHWYTFAGTLNFDFKPILLRASGVYTTLNENAGAFGITQILNNRVGVRDQKDGSFSLRLTHVLSANVFYELNAGYVFSKAETYDPWLKDDYWAYGDSAANAAVGFTWTRTAVDVERKDVGPYNTPDPYTVYLWNFPRTGAPSVNYSKGTTQSLNFSGAVSMLLGKHHNMKIGGDIQLFTIRNWGISVATSAMRQYLATLQKDSPGKSIDELKKLALWANGVNNYGYDIFGNETDEEGFYAPHKPLFASAYIQDKIEYEDIILNLGLRYDFIDIDNKKPIDPYRPEYSIDKNTNGLKPNGWVDVPTFSAVSPRIGVSFPVTDQTFFHAQYGKFIQQPNLGDSYVGYHRWAYMLTAGYEFGDALPGPNVRPTRTTQYELGFTQQVSDFLSFDITGYYKDVKDQVLLLRQNADPASGIGDYYVKTNGDFATTKGVEFTVNMRRYQRLAINGNIAFQDAKGTGSYSGSNTGIVGAPLIPGQPFYPKFISPLSFNKNMTANLNVDYRFGANDGPAILSNFGINVLITYGSGRPYTRGIGSDPAQVGASIPGDGDERSRSPIEPLGSSFMPANFNVDLKVDKTFNLFDRLNATIYVSVLNLFNQRSVENVFLVTGSAENDGFLTDPKTYQYYYETYGQDFIDMYKAIRLENRGDLYGPSRQIRLGFRLEY